MLAVHRLLCRDCPVAALARRYTDRPKATARAAGLRGATANRPRSELQSPGSECGRALSSLFPLRGSIAFRVLALKASSVPKPPATTVRRTTRSISSQCGWTYVAHFRPLPPLSHTGRQCISFKHPWRNEVTGHLSFARPRFL